VANNGAHLRPYIINGINSACNFFHLLSNNCHPCSKQS